MWRSSGNETNIQGISSNIVLELVDVANPYLSVRVPLSSGILIGRGRKCDLLIDDRLLARKHCVVFGQRGVFYVRALSKRHPLVVNGQPQPPRVDVAVVSGSTIGIGSHWYRLNFVVWSNNV